MTPSWRYFRKLELREALAHTDAGGIAVHESGRTRGGKPTAHLLAGSRGQLMTAAEELGLKGRYVQMTNRPHFDLFGEPLMLALRKCMAEEGEPVAKCRICGCTEARACPGGCYWFEPDLCSRCAGVL